MTRRRDRFQEYTEEAARLREHADVLHRARGSEDGDNVLLIATVDVLAEVMRLRADVLDIGARGIDCLEGISRDL